MIKISNEEEDFEIPAFFKKTKILMMNLNHYDQSKYITGIFHFPVMLDEVIKICSPKKGGIFIDCTFGGGGYSKKYLNTLKQK